MDIGSDIAKRLKEAIENSGFTYTELEEKTEIAKSSLQRYANGTTKKIPVDVIGKISDAIGCSFNWIMGRDSEKLKSPEVTSDVAIFPVISSASEIYSEPAAEDWSGETVAVPAEYLGGHSKEDFFVLSVHGDSMYPLFIDGDKVLVLKQSVLTRSGEIGAILFDDDSAKLKKIEYTDGENFIKLIPINPQYPPKTIGGPDLKHFHILGIPKMLIRKFI